MTEQTPSRRSPRCALPIIGHVRQITQLNTIFEYCFCNPEPKMKIVISVYSIHVCPKLLQYYLPRRARIRLVWRSKGERVQDKTKTSSQVWIRPMGTRGTENRKERVAKMRKSSDSDVRKRKICRADTSIHSTRQKEGPS